MRRRLLVSTAVAMSITGGGIGAMAGVSQAADSGTPVTGLGNSIVTPTADDQSDILTIAQNRGDKRGVVDIAGGSTEAGTDANLHGPNGTAAQRFKFVPRGEYFQIRPMTNQNMCVEARGNGPWEGQRVNQYTCDVNSYNQPNQLWKIREIPNGVRLESALTATTGEAWHLTTSTSGYAAGTFVTDLPLILSKTATDNNQFSLHRQTASVQASMTVAGGRFVYKEVRCPSPYSIREDVEGSDDVDPTYFKFGDSAVVRWATSELHRDGTLQKDTNGAEFRFENLAAPYATRTAGVDLQCNLYLTKADEVVEV